MPLTIAHPAAVLPFRHAGIPFSALLIGSIAPDFEYMLHLSPQSDFSHTASGLFTFCLPAGLLALWIWHRIWRPPIVALLGPEYRHLAGPFRFGPSSRFLMLCGGCLIGAFLHMLWDSFTHEYGWFVSHAESLRQSVPLPGSLKIPLYQLLQFASTVIGCIALAFAAFYHHTWTWPHVVANWPLIFVVGWMTIGGGVALGMLVAGDVSTAEGLRRRPGCGLVVGTTILLMVSTFLCMVWHLKRWAERIMS